ncbi:hypothetical protein WCLP8_3390003 [uncultured Gammaproteobacteria bacterium]
MLSANPPLTALIINSGSRNPPDCQPQPCLNRRQQQGYGSGIEAKQPGLGQSERAVDHRHHQPSNHGQGERPTGHVPGLPTLDGLGLTGKEAPRYALAGGYAEVLPLSRMSSSNSTSRFSTNFWQSRLIRTRPLTLKLANIPCRLAILLLDFGRHPLTHFCLQPQ